MIELIYQRKQPGSLPYNRPQFFTDDWRNPYNYQEFDDFNKNPFFIFYSDGLLIAAAHLPWPEFDGDSGACVRFTKKYRNAENPKTNRILCFDPLLKFTIREELG